MTHKNDPKGYERVSAAKLAVGDKLGYYGMDFGHWPIRLGCAEFPPTHHNTITEISVMKRSKLKGSKKVLILTIDNGRKLYATAGEAFYRVIK